MCQRNINATTSLFIQMQMLQTQTPPPLLPCPPPLPPLRFIIFSSHHSLFFCSFFLIMFSFHLSNFPKLKHKCRIESQSIFIWLHIFILEFCAIGSLWDGTWTEKGSLTFPLFLCAFCRFFSFLYILVLLENVLPRRR